MTRAADVRRVLAQAAGPTSAARIARELEIDADKVHQTLNILKASGMVSSPARGVYVLERMPHENSRRREDPDNPTLARPTGTRLSPPPPPPGPCPHSDAVLRAMRGTGKAGTVKEWQARTGYRRLTLTRLLERLEWAGLVARDGDLWRTA